MDDLATYGRPDPRYPDDGLARIVDELELAVDLEAWRPRYVLGFDGTRDGDVDVVVLNLTTGRIEEPHR